MLALDSRSYTINVNLAPTVPCDHFEQMLATAQRPTGVHGTSHRAVQLQNQELLKAENIKSRVASKQRLTVSYFPSTTGRMALADSFCYSASPCNLVDSDTLEKHFQAGLC